MERSEQNQALRDLDELVDLLTKLSEFHGNIRTVVMRSRFGSGERHHRAGELAAKLSTHEDMTGTPGPAQSDTTGEDACWDERRDKTSNSIAKLKDTLLNAKATAEIILDLSNIDVERRAKRTVPDCLACGDPCHGGVRNGFDDKCRKRWDRMGRPDRGTFVYLVKHEKDLEQQKLEKKSG